MFSAYVVSKLDFIFVYPCAREGETGGNVFCDEKGVKGGLGTPFLKFGTGSAVRNYLTL